MSQNPNKPFDLGDMPWPASKPGVVDVACIVLPDGQTIWVEDPNVELVESYIRGWREALPQFLKDRYEDAKVNLGVVHIRMLREDYLRAVNGG